MLYVWLVAFCPNQLIRKFGLLECAIHLTCSYSLYMDNSVTLLFLHQQPSSTTAKPFCPKQVGVG
jgi:hypothetical protein